MSIFILLYIVPFVFLYVEYNYCSKKRNKEYFNTNCLVLENGWGEYCSKKKNNSYKIEKLEKLIREKVLHRKLVFPRDGCGYGHGQEIDRTKEKGR